MRRRVLPAVPIIRAILTVGTTIIAVILSNSTAADAQRPPSGVIVAEIIERPLVEQITLAGSVHARRTTIVASQTEGIVVARMKEAGQTVRRREPIYRLDNDQLRAGMVAALADVKLRRFRQEQSAELLTQEAISEDAAREAEYELDRARSQLQNLQSRLENLTIRAPFAGHIVEPLVELGQWVNRGDGVVSVVAIDTVRIYVNVPERQVPSLHLGDQAMIHIDALGGDDIPARIVAILAQGYNDSHTFPVIVEFLNTHDRIRAGMAARVQLTTTRDTSALLVHKDAIVNNTRGTFLFVAVDGSATMKPVQTGLAYQGYVAVEGELNPGDLAIVRGNERLQDGQAVRVVRKLQ